MKTKHPAYDWSCFLSAAVLGVFVMYWIIFQPVEAMWMWDEVWQQVRWPLLAICSFWIVAPLAAFYFPKRTQP